MKLLLITLFVMSGLNAMASSADENYCADEHKNVFVVRTINENPLHPSEVEKAEIVGFLPSGNVVLIMCPGTGVIPKSTYRPNFYIINRELIFVKTNVSKTGKFQVIGFNPSNSKYLVRENSIIRRYYVVNKSSQNVISVPKQNKRVINK